MNNAPQDFIAVIDFGAQYNQLIVRRVREAKVYCEIFTPKVTAKELAARKVKGIILSGGPASVYAPGAPKCDPKILELGVPLLGICYGMQLICYALGNKVTPAADREYGGTELRVLSSDRLFQNIPRQTPVWMSHGDKVEGVSQREFEPIATTKNCATAAVRYKKKAFYGVQFHPEVVHTPYGAQILRNFVYGVCRCKPTWEMQSYIDRIVHEVRATVGDKGVLCALSGGVDSSVVATLIHRAIGDQLVCVFVDNGLLRQGEAEKVEGFFRKKMHLNLRCVDASTLFLKRLRGVIDPEEKRRRIGKVFIEVFQKEAKKLKAKLHLEFLAQGTLYPDVIESRSAFGGPSVTIKTHHNVGGLPAKLGFTLIEPLRTLFKDEVRELGRQLDLPEELVTRQPFPGPGLSVRVIGEVTRERLNLLRKADAIVAKEIEQANLHPKLWQYFAVLLPVQTVGVMGDERTYENVVALRIVESQDGMTADWARLPQEVLAHISSRITNEVKGINRVVYDISSKPPSTIEWE